MKTFRITVPEIWDVTYEVEAETVDEAVMKVSLRNIQMAENTEVKEHYRDYTCNDVGDLTIEVKVSEHQFARIHRG